MSKAQETVLEINLKALETNYNFLKSRLNSQTKFLAVVKAFAYGSDMVIVAKKLQDLNVDYFAVAYVKEGVVLRNAGITKPILVLHPQAVNFEELIERCLEPSLYSAKSLSDFTEKAHQLKQKNYPVHIKFNTGLNRLGFWENDVDFIVSKLKATSSVRVRSVFSHLVASEDLSAKEFSLNQIESFRYTSQKLEKLLGYRPMNHILNTSGVLNYPEAQLDMVRSGIGLYGFGNMDKYKDSLKPIATLKTIISQIHNIEKGESVGYNFGFVSDNPKTTATLPIGHADGIGRQYGKGKGSVIINHKKAPIIGNVCMDMLMVDVSGIDCKEGDEVVIFGESHNAADFAKSVDTISYEILTAISPRVKRVMVNK